MLKTAKFEDQVVPEYITHGHAARFIQPVAQEVCKGKGLDIGCNRPEWALPEAMPIDPVIDDKWHALQLPTGPWDYIFSSHCLEHVPNYVEALEFWTSQIKPGGILFLYLPHPDCLYWRPWKMPTRKHIHQFYPKQMYDIFTSLGYKNIFVSERDLAYSFAIYGEKNE